jgi:hypothetical protein
LPFKIRYQPMRGDIHGVALANIVLVHQTVDADSRLSCLLQLSRASPYGLL